MRAIWAALERGERAELFETGIYLFARERAEAFHAKAFAAEAAHHGPVNHGAAQHAAADVVPLPTEAVLSQLAGEASGAGDWLAGGFTGYSAQHSSRLERAHISRGLRSAAL